MSNQVRNACISVSSATFPMLTAVILIVGCSSVQPDRQAETHIQIEQEVGFTITEDAPVSGELRTDYQAALSLLEQGEHAAGIEILERIVQTAPYLAAPRIDLGIAYHRLGNLEAAEANLQAAAELSPDHPVIHNELGIIYRKTGRFAEARASYEKALAVYPGFHYARRNLAVLCDLYLADPGCALDNYEAYMQTVARDDEASMWITDIRNRMDQ